MAEEDVNIVLNSDDKDLEDEMDDDSNPPRKEAKTVKGRGKASDIHENKYSGNEVFESLESEGRDGEPVKSVEGWNVIVTGLHPETQEDSLHDLFSEYGTIMSLTLAIQRRTGNVLGYSLIEFDTKDEAQKAINNINGKAFMENILSVDFAFVAPPKISKSNRHSSRSGGKRRRN